MRREFVLAFLGIICISSFSSLLSGYVQIEVDKVLLNTVAGSVGAGNFSYWQLGYMGPLLIELTSLSGDADLYVSDNMQPSYEVDRNHFSSATCGHDIVYIPPEYPRPIGIAVFGHWSHSVSTYSIQIFLDTSVVYTEEELQTIERYHRGETREIVDKTSERYAYKKQDAAKPRFLRFLDLVDMIFEMVVN